MRASTDLVDLRVAEAFIARSNAPLRTDPFSPKTVIPDGDSRSGTPCRKVLGGPRTPLRFGGDGRGRTAQQKLRIYKRQQAQLLLRDPSGGPSISLTTIQMEIPLQSLRDSFPVYGVSAHAPMSAGGGEGVLP